MVICTVITKSKILKCADSIVTGMNLKRGENVVIRAGIHAQKLFEEIGILCFKRSALPLILTSSDTFTARMYKEIFEEILETTPKHYLAAMKEADAYIVVEPFKDPKIRNVFPREKIAATTKANIPIRKVLYGEEDSPGKKWTYAGWPTREAADFYNVEYQDLERLIIDGIATKALHLRKNTSKIAGFLRERDLIHIKDRKGTDFICKIKSRRVNEDDGIVDDEDIKMGDLGNNLPAGEVFVAPHETYGKGTLFCPVTIDRFTNKIIRNITLHFENGRLLLNECTAENNCDKMIDSFRQCLKIDDKEKTIRTTNIAELGIGCNPAIDRAIGYILTDEKLSGSVHVAFGSNLGYGGTSKSSIHWDFVTDPSVTVEDAETKEVLIQDGETV